jgi:hypothetical protein
MAAAHSSSTQQTSPTGRYGRIRTLTWVILAHDGPDRAVILPRQWIGALARSDALLSRHEHRNAACVKSGGCSAVSSCSA